MRGLQTPVRAIRRQVFTEVAKLGFKANAETLVADMEAIPYEIVGEDSYHYVVLKKSSSLQDVPCSQRTPKTFFLIGLLRMAAYIHPPLSLIKSLFCNIPQ